MISHGLPARVWLVVLIAGGLLALIPGVAVASTAQEEQEGSKILRELESGKLQCNDAGAEDFERVGEYVMGRMLGSTNSHEAMDGAMSRMMGSDSEPQIHEAMGRRFAGCGGGQLPSDFGRMTGAFNAMGMVGDGMMGGPPQGGRYGPSGSMMGGYWSQSSADDDDFDGPSAAAMVGVMAVLIGAVAVAALLLSRRRPPGPLDTLKQRYAAGELTNEEYEERRQLLEGS
ncbi:MAG: SHOCT domain-containing protein [Thermoleophilia bacterium]|nr:SHOCT domain-containing protein [Thermoleophilia bacterium]